MKTPLTPAEFQELSEMDQFDYHHTTGHYPLATRAMLNGLSISFETFATYDDDDEPVTFADLQTAKRFFAERHIRIITLEGDLGLAWPCVKGETLSNSINCFLAGLLTERYPNTAQN